MFAPLVALAVLTAGPPMGAKGMQGDPDPLGLRDARDVRPEVAYFSGRAVTVTLRAKKHRLIIHDELAELVLEGGGHTLMEQKPLRLPSPMLLAECSKVNKPDGPLHVLGTGGVKLKGPKTLVVLGVEPFPGPTPAARHRMVMDNGTGLFTANTADVLLLPESYRYFVVDGLDPASTYRVKVGGKPSVIEQVIVAVDRPVGLGDGESPADAVWGRTRFVLKGGMTAELPATAKVAFILAGVRGLHEEPLNVDERKVDVTVELIKGTVVESAARPEEAPAAPDKVVTFTTTMARQLLADESPSEALPLIRQCLQKDPKNADCHLLYSQAFSQLEDRPSAIKHACLAVKHGAGSLSGEKARELLGGDTKKCQTR